jgi:hypothetical protein
MGAQSENGPLSLSLLIEKREPEYIYVFSTAKKENPNTEFLSLALCEWRITAVLKRDLHILTCVKNVILLTVSGKGKMAFLAIGLEMYYVAQQQEWYQGYRYYIEK